MIEIEPGTPRRREMGAIEIKVVLRKPNGGIAQRRKQAVSQPRLSSATPPRNPHYLWRQLLHSIFIKGGPWPRFLLAPNLPRSCSG
jgi:hypothetical protein